MHVWIKNTVFERRQEFMPLLSPEFYFAKPSMGIMQDLRRTAASMFFPKLPIFFGAIFGSCRKLYTTASNICSVNPGAGALMRPLAKSRISCIYAVYLDTYRRYLKSTVRSAHVCISVSKAAEFSLYYSAARFHVLHRISILWMQRSKWKFEFESNSPFECLVYFYARVLNHAFHFKEIQSWFAWLNYSGHVLSIP
jgi:hypothetical protein